MSNGLHFRNIKVCVFDAYGTLFDVHSAVGPHCERLVFVMWPANFRCCGARSKSSARGYAA